MFQLQEHLSTLPITGLEKTANWVASGGISTSPLPDVCPRRLLWTSKKLVYENFALISYSGLLYFVTCSSLLLTRLSHPGHSLSELQTHPRLPAWILGSTTPTPSDKRQAVYTTRLKSLGARQVVSTKSLWKICRVSHLLHYWYYDYTASSFLHGSQYIYRNWFDSLLLRYLCVAIKGLFAMNTLLSLRQFQSSCFV